MAKAEEQEQLRLYDFVEVLNCNSTDLISESPVGEEEGAKEPRKEFFIQTFAFTTDTRAILIAAVSSCRKLSSKLNIQGVS